MSELYGEVDGRRSEMDRRIADVERELVNAKEEVDDLTRTCTGYREEIANLKEKVALATVEAELTASAAAAATATAPPPPTVNSSSHAEMIANSLTSEEEERLRHKLEELEEALRISDTKHTVSRQACETLEKDLAQIHAQYKAQIGMLVN